MREPGSDRDVRTAADADGFDGRNRHQRLRQPAVEFAVPLHVAAEAGRHAARDDFERAAHRVAGVAGAIDLRDHLLLELRVDAVQRRVGADGVRLFKGDGQTDRAARSRRSQNTWLTMSAPTAASS